MSKSKKRRRQDDLIKVWVISRLFEQLRETTQDIIEYIFGF
ncbi:hypothetical protein [Mobiluncus mulieris]|nr:hypothetical protein [Mobiluncus mulieris]